MAEISAHRTDATAADFFATAAVSGAEYVEIDIRRTADGEIIARHDHHVNGVVLAGASYAEACRAAGHRIPRVREAMESLAGRVRGHLDLKERGAELEIVEMALEVLGSDGFVVTTKEPESIAKIDRAFPEVTTVLSVGRSLWERGALRDLSPLGLLRSCGADWVAVNHRLARLGVLRQCWRAAVPAMVWTVNAEPLMRRFLRDPRVAVLITDHPGRAVRLRDGETRNPPTTAVGG